MPRAEESDRDRRKPRRAAHGAQRVANILKERIDGGPSPHGAKVFRDQCPIAKRTRRGGSRVPLAHAGFLLFLRLEVEV